MAEIETYNTYIVKQIMPADGWQAVYYDDEHGHFLCPVHALALAYTITRGRPSGRVAHPQTSLTPKELWEIVGVSYSPGDAWTVCNESYNYCGLLTPGMNLETFLEQSLVSIGRLLR